jgi:hypothetical protein
MKIKINRYLALIIIYIPILLIARLLRLPIEFYVGFFFIGLVVLFIRDYRTSTKEVPKNGKK